MKKKALRKKKKKAERDNRAALDCEKLCLHAANSKQETHSQRKHNRSVNCAHRLCLSEQTETLEW